MSIVPSTFGDKKSTQLRQLEFVAPVLAAAGVAVLGAIGLNKIWDLDKAIGLAIAGVILTCISFAIAVWFVGKAYAGKEPTSTTITGAEAAEASYILENATLPTKATELADAINLAGTDDSKAISNNKFDQALLLLRAWRASASTAVQPAKEDQFQREIGPIDSALERWKTAAQEAEAASGRASQDRLSQEAKGVLVGALVMLLVGMILLLAANKKDTAAELTSAAEQRKSILELESNSAVEQRSKTLEEERKSAELSHDRALTQPIQIDKVVKVTASLNDADTDGLNRLRVGCDSIDKGTVISASAIGGSWQKPILLVPNDQNGSCGNVVFIPAQPPLLSEKVKP